MLNYLSFDMNHNFYIFNNIKELKYFLLQIDRFIDKTLIIY